MISTQWKSSKMKKLLFLIIVLLVIVGVTSAQTDSDLSKSYVSLNGNFSINFPADWHQIPTGIIDQYLASKKAGRPLYDYDAVFAPTNSNPYYSGSYFIMGIEKVGDLSDKQIDSVLVTLSKNFGKGIKYFPVANFMADIQTDAPNYDKETKTVTIYNKIVQDNTSIKNSLIIMKFYEFGIVNFYCYSMGDSFESDNEIFSKIVASLSTDDIQSKLPRENVKVADIDNTKKSYSTDEDSSSNIAIYVALGVVILVVLRRRKKRKNNS